MSTDLWLGLATSIGTLILVIPGLLYAYYVLETWIGDPKSYERVIAAVESGEKRPPSVA